MKSSLLWSVSIAFLVFISLQSIYPQTIIPGGDVSGTWTAAGSPYNVQGEITIHADSTLNIEPGVTVDFQGYYGLTVNGYLEAVGTAGDSIHFSASTGWKGITFSNAPDSSHLSYCTIRRGSGNLVNSNPSISHCLFSGPANVNLILTTSGPKISYCEFNNASQNSIFAQQGSDFTLKDCVIRNTVNEGGIACWGGALTMINCTISDNNSWYPGGGIYCIYNTTTITNCTIRNNCSELIPNSGLPGGGGGVYCENGTVIITHCTINGNSDSNSNKGGGGIAFNNVIGTLSYCTIFDNQTMSQGGGIAIYNGGNLSVDHCTIDGNIASSGAGISIDDSATADIMNSIFSNHYPYPFCIYYNLNTVSIKNTDFYNNLVNIHGNVPTGFGTLSTTNINGDSCDVYYNIFLNPLFADAANDDFHLTWANWPTSDSTKSPCIDAGDPSSPLDPDNTITDMGAFSFDQSIPNEVAEEILAPSEYRLYQNYPNPFNPGTKIKYAIPQSSNVVIKVFNVLGSEITTLVNEEKSLGNYEVEFNAENIPSGVYFYQLKAGKFLQTKKMILLK